MASTPQQSDSDSIVEPAGAQPGSAHAFFDASGQADESGAQNDRLRLDEGGGSDIRTSNATTTAGKVRDAAADVLGAQVYRAGAERVGRGLGVEMGAQKDRVDFKLNRESIAGVRARAREAYTQGKADRAAGGRTFRENIRQQNKARVAKSVASGVAADAGKQLGKETVKDAAKVAAATGAKAVPGAGLVTAIPAGEIKKTVQDTARDLANMRVGRAATRLVKGLGKSAAITVFRASYDPYVIGLTGGLSLLGTFLLGTVLILVPGALTAFEKLIVAMAWVLLLIIFCILLVTVVVMICSGFSLPGILLKAASLVSSTAAGLDAVCANVSIFNVLSGALNAK